MKTLEKLPVFGLLHLELIVLYDLAKEINVLAFLAVLELEINVIINNKVCILQDIHWIVQVAVNIDCTTSSEYSFLKFER